MAHGCGRLGGSRTSKQKYIEETSLIREGKWEQKAAKSLLLGGGRKKMTVTSR